MKKNITIILIVFFSLPFLFYGIGDMIALLTRVHVKDEFYIEELEGYDSKSLWNGIQIFSDNVTEAYWNNDSLVVSGSNGCYLIIFKETKYKDEMISISCVNLKDYIKNKPIKNYKK